MPMILISLPSFFMERAGGGNSFLTTIEDHRIAKKILIGKFLSK
jgi:hypothetical protein